MCRPDGRGGREGEREGGKGKRVRELNRGREGGREGGRGVPSCGRACSPCCPQPRSVLLLPPEEK